MGEAQRLVGVLLHQQHRQPFRPVQHADGVEDATHDQRCQAERGLVQQQQLRLRHQRPGDGQHLLLAARKRSAALRLAFLEAGKELEGPLHARPRIAAELLRTHQQILAHAHARKDPAPLRRLRDAEAHHLMRRQAGNVRAVEQDAAGTRLGRAADRHQQRGLAGAVGADQGHDLPLVDADGDVVQRAHRAIGGGDAVQLQHAHAACSSSPSSPSPR